MNETYNQSYAEWFNKQLTDQFGAWIWNDTKVDAVAVNQEDFAEIVINQNTDFFASIEAPYLKTGNVLKLYSDGFSTIESIITAYEADLVAVLGENGRKVYAGLQGKLNPILLYKLMGATPYFGRGVGVRKFKKLLTGLQVASVGELPLLNVSQIVTVEGFEETTALKIVNGMDDFMNFYETIKDYVELDLAVASSEGSLQGEKVCLTGFRNKQLQARIEAEGGTVQSAASGKTTIVVAKNPNGNSGKLKKARDLGIKIVGIEEFEEMF